jgi:hypothetical protein
MGYVGSGALNLALLTLISRVVSSAYLAGALSTVAGSLFLYLWLKRAVFIHPRSPQRPPDA